MDNGFNRTEIPLYDWMDQWVTEMERKQTGTPSSLRSRTCGDAPAANERLDTADAESYCSTLPTTRGSREQGDREHRVPSR